MKEIWLPVVGFEESYEVSQFGRVRSVDRTLMRKSKGGSYQTIKLTGKLLKPLRTGQGNYGAVALSKPGMDQKRFYIHRLVLEAFVGPCPKGMECRHLDGNPRNNSLRNILWGTPVQNALDKNLHGTHNKGERNGKAKLNVNQVLEILYLSREMPEHKIASIYGVSPSLVYNIIAKKRWGHVQD